MNRDQALQWLVDNLKAWPTKVSLKSFANGWQTIHYLWSNGGTAIELFKHGFENITEKDWLSAKLLLEENKPSWADAPAEAKILVRNADGSWRFGSYMEAVPGDSDDFGWVGKGDGQWFDPKQPETIHPNWRSSIERRPDIRK